MNKPATHEICRRECKLLGLWMARGHDDDLGTSESDRFGIFGFSSHSLGIVLLVGSEKIPLALRPCLRTGRCPELRPRNAG